MSESRRTVRRTTVAAATLGLAAPLIGAMPASAQATEPFISELHYDNTGTDTGAAVEVQAEAGTDLTDGAWCSTSGATGPDTATERPARAGPGRACSAPLRPWCRWAAQVDPRHGGLVVGCLDRVGELGVDVDDVVVVGEVVGKVWAEQDLVEHL